MKGFKRITFNSNVMGGQACIRGITSGSEVESEIPC